MGRENNISGFTKRRDLSKCGTVITPVVEQPGIRSDFFYTGGILSVMELRSDNLKH